MNGTLEVVYMDQLSLETLGRHLQSLRVARGWSLSGLAAAAGVAKSNLSRLEQGNGNPTLDTIWRLAVQLNVPSATSLPRSVCRLVRKVCRSGLWIRGKTIPG